MVGQKRKRGRPALTQQALIVQPSETQSQPPETQSYPPETQSSQDDETEDYLEAPVSKKIQDTSVNTSVAVSDNSVSKRGRGRGRGR